MGFMDGVPDYIDLQRLMDANRFSIANVRENDRCVLVAYFFPCSRFTYRSYAVVVIGQYAPRIEIWSLPIRGMFYSIMLMKSRRSALLVGGDLRILS